MIVTLSFCLAASRNLQAEAFSAEPSRNLRAHAEEPTRRHLLSFGTEYCHEDAPLLGTPMAGCYETLGNLLSTTPACDAVTPADVSASSMCRTPARVWHSDRNGPLFDANGGRDFATNFDFFTYKFSFCTSLYVFVSLRGERSNFCRSFTEYGGYAQNVAPNRNPNSCRWYQFWCRDCPDGFSKRGSTCAPNGALLGQTCGTSVECRNADAQQSPYDPYHLSCASTPLTGGSPRCVPSALAIASEAGSTLVPQTQCECGWFRAWAGFACGSDTCLGHPCVLSTRNMNKYCDFQQDNDNSLFGVGLLGYSAEQNGTDADAVWDPVVVPTPAPSEDEGDLWSR